MFLRIPYVHPMPSPYLKFSFVLKQATPAALWRAQANSFGKKASGFAHRYLLVHFPSSPIFTRSSPLSSLVNARQNPSATFRSFHLFSFSSLLPFGDSYDFLPFLLFAPPPPSGVFLQYFNVSSF